MIFSYGRQVMKKEPWGLIIYDRDRMLAAFTEQLYDDTEYNKRVVELQKQGYGFSCQSYPISKRQDCEDNVRANMGYEIVSLGEVFDVGKDERA
jgi:hypothetical protein